MLTTNPGISIQSGRDILGDDTTLKFLSIVETARVPLILVSSTPREVSVTDIETETWISTILLGSSSDDSNEVDTWWKTARSDSPLGILVAVDQPKATTPLGLTSKATELLIYASRAPSSSSNRPPTPPHSSPSLQQRIEHQAKSIRVLVLPLCSDLLTHDALNVPSPPLSPAVDSLDAEPRFLPLSLNTKQSNDEIVNVPPVRKRKPVNDKLDQAAERRQKARKKSVVKTDASTELHAAEVETAQESHRRLGSNTQPIHLQSRPLSRASSVSSMRLGSAREASLSTTAKRSSLARVESAPALPATEDSPSIELKNKDLISKIVMTGLRMHGLIQSKPRKSRPSSAAASPTLDVSFESLATERKNDEHYKLMYHQVYKGTCFAARSHIAAKSLQPHADALRETADRLLSIYCNDPFIVEDERLKDEFTPGGRKAFGSSAIAASERRNPFLVPQQLGNDSKSNTPCDRSSKERPP